ncbi:MAG: AMP-binding protein, partial [Chloroflexales bacterium]
MPPSTRSVAASLRGFALRGRRYGPDSEQLVAAALERDHWSAERWQQWQAERLAYVLHRAATRVPYYRDLWAQRRRQGDRAAWDVLANWPILGKEALRRNPQSFVADDCELRCLYRDSTSGTTGTPLVIYLARTTIQQWYAIVEARIRRWHGVSRNEHWAIMGGQVVVPFQQQRPPFWVYNAALHQLYLSTHHLSPQHIAAYAEALRRYAPTHMIVYPSAAALLASEMLRQHVALPQLRVVLSNAEQLFDQQRERIGAAFQCPVRDTYGMGEIAVGASECAHGTLHLWPDTGKLEVLAAVTDTVAPPGTTGRFIATGLLNAAMPLIRYEVGDRGQLAPTTTCACGRTLPVIERIEGRINDLILTPDGRKVFWLNPAFYG